MTNFEKYKEGVNCSEIPNNSDCVSRRAAVEAIANQSRFSAEEIINICDKSVQDENGWLGGLKEAILAVLELPSAQPEIIYCGECKHMMPDGRCREFADRSIYPSASDFCSAAERKANGSD